MQHARGVQARMRLPYPPGVDQMPERNLHFGRRVHCSEGSAVQIAAGAEDEVDGG